MGPHDDRPADPRLKVFIVEDHALTRDTLGAVLEDEGFEVVGCCPAAAATVQVVAAVAPDVCLLSLGLVGQSMIEVCRAVTEAAPRIACVMLSLRDRPGEITASFRAGASGYVLASLTGDRLARALRDAVRWRHSARTWELS
ncbi:DNA-binding NarL/FixJ family response regulator [Sinomonas atrocyanea]|uniref:response regulator n=1 Tax=Sinomonas atrocyanea TaxID=37927 RepID=UPI00278AB0E6|nr:response regulator [Sinomonas atrocyanea]MDP9885903.1 DNA-binding NarL/FixJ family response regulator [Sinomonas atrocyanea]